jgi:hypothetical protein
MSWRNSGRVGIPLITIAIVGGGWAYLIPEDSITVMVLLFVCAAAAVLLTFFSKE